MPSQFQNPAVFSCFIKVFCSAVSPLLYLPVAKDILRNFITDQHFNFIHLESEVQHEVMAHLVTSRVQGRNYILGFRTKQSKNLCIQVSGRLKSKTDGKTIAREWKDGSVGMMNRTLLLPPGLNGC